jgi:cytoskeletal protein CcmA (bactofilin family)
MFGKSKDNSTEHDRVPPAAQQPQRSPVRPSEAPTSAEETSFISAGITIIGKITGNGTVKISGRIEGEVHASAILVNDGAQVEGDIVAEEVTIGGQVKGTIRANRVKLNSNAVVEGDIFHQSLSIAENARFEGSSRRDETVIDALRVPLARLAPQADTGNIAAIEENRKHNGPLENDWHATA